MKEQDFRINVPAWQVVRTVAELSILTRASYLMLLFVPILAGLWPAVPAWLYKEPIGLDYLQHSLADTLLELRAPRELTDEQIKTSVDTLTNTMTKLDSTATERALLSGGMPVIWLMVYFSALLAVLAQLIYQAFAPEAIRRNTIDQYRSEKLAAYERHPDRPQLARAAIGASLSEDDQITLCAIVGRKVFLDNYWKAIHPAYDAFKYRGNLDIKDGRLPRTTENIFDEIVRLSEDKTIPESTQKSVTNQILKLDAEREYRKHSETNQFAGKTSLILYVSAIALLIVIVAMQSSAVVTATRFG